MDNQNRVGEVTGLAWTEVGGDLLTIETASVPGKGKFSYTGSLGDVMIESIQAAMMVVRARADKLGIADDFHEKRDIHVHVPDGATPKDGPSAGVTLTSSIISALNHIPVSTKISMTGEITLRGKVGIIGGVKEKVISAFRAGVNEIFIPRDDERFLEDIPQEILQQITIHLVDTYDDIFNIIFKDIKPFIKPVKEAKSSTIN